MKILVVGCRGQLGSGLMEILDRGYTEIGKIDDRLIKAEVLGYDFAEMDITDLNSVRKKVKEYMPDVIINAAAYTNVDGCESDFETAYKVNSIGPRNLAIIAEEVSAKFVHISTDYVFKGDNSIPYREYDITGPVCVYGKTKLAGDEYVKSFCSRYFILRTSWVYGYHGKNFVKTIMNAAREKGHLDVVDDQRGNPTNVEDLAHHILKLILTEEYGIYHCTGNGECSWYDFAVKIVEYAKINCTVSPMKSDKLTRAAKRPAYSSMDNMMLRCTVGDEMRQWEDALKDFIENYRG